MSRFRFLTAVDSFGSTISATIEGVPAGLALDVEWIQRDIARHLWGYGAFGDDLIGLDQVEISAGVRNGRTVGTPLVLRVPISINHSSPEKGTDAAENAEARLTHESGLGDLARAILLGQQELRNVVERSMLRESAARIAVGAVARRFLDEFGVTIRSHTVAIAGIVNPVIEGDERDIDWDAVERSPARCADRGVGDRMMDAIGEAGRQGDTVGGTFEVLASGVPIGLGTYVQWDRKLSSRIGQAMMSITSAKGVEIGGGFRLAHLRGSEIRDVIRLADEPKSSYGWGPVTNHAGGIVGGMTNGEAIVVKVGLRPVSLRAQRAAASNGLERLPLHRGDVCVVPAAGVLGEAMLAVVLADGYLEKFGGDHLAETRRNFEAYVRAVQRADEPNLFEFDELELESV